MQNEFSMENELIHKGGTLAWAYFFSPLPFYILNGEYFKLFYQIDFDTHINAHS